MNLKRDADADAESEAARPGAGRRPIPSGDPLVPSTRPVLPKPAPLVAPLGVERVPGMMELRLVSLLLAESWGSAGDPAGSRNTAPTAMLRRAAGRGGEDRNRHLAHAMEALASFPMDWPAADGGAGDRFPLLRDAEVPAGSGEAFWRLDERAAAILRDVRVWAPIRLDAVARLRGRHALLLYEILAGRSNMRRPFWRPGLDEFRWRLGVRGRRRDWDRLRRRVIAPSVAAINERTEVGVDFGPIRDRSGRRVVGISFHVSRKDRRTAEAEGTGVAGGLRDGEP